MKSEKERTRLAKESLKRMLKFIDLTGIDSSFVQNELRVLARHVKNQYNDQPIIIPPLDLEESSDLN